MRKVLVVDDDDANRLILKALLQQEGYEVVTAANGSEAVDVFREARPELVLMDVVMPVMDGYEATEIIKSQSGDRFVPVIFLTGLTDEESLGKCIASGGDDFLTKPYNRVLLQAKINALERIKKLQNTILEQRDELAYYKKKTEREYEITKSILANIVHPGCLNASNIKYLMAPAETFNGDLLLAAKNPRGGLYVILGDFTGHGLNAAIGILPVADIFYSMTGKGYSIENIIREINGKLQRILPTGLFLSVCLLEFDAENNTIQLWNSGLPDVLIVDGKAGGVKHRVSSGHLPLGILDNEQMDGQVEVLELDNDDRIYIYSDGLIEAINGKGEPFGQERLLAQLDGNSDPSSSFDGIVQSLESFRGRVPQEDDITLIEVRCDGGQEKVPTGEGTVQRSSVKAPLGWRVSLELDGDTLRGVNPLPIIMQVFREIQGGQEYHEKLYTILAELFNNALEHGLLGLSSLVKDGPHGFVDYYRHRETALAKLQDGKIVIEVQHKPEGGRGETVIKVADTGPGFDFRSVVGQGEAQNGLCGRGILLVRSLCTEMTYHGNGNTVEAICHD